MRALHSSKEREVASEHEIGLTFIDPKEKANPSITGRAEVRIDHAKAAEIWKSTDHAWWEGPECASQQSRMVKAALDIPAD